jgi:hypothetical protein
MVIIPSDHSQLYNPGRSYSWKVLQKPLIIQMVLPYYAPFNKSGERWATGNES